MGYTHYWTLENAIEQSDWNKFLEGARQIVGTAEDAGIQLEDNSSDTEIVINGVGAGAHETFVITSDEIGFNCCKTAQKPYDMVVTAILIHLKKCLGSKVVIKSDGNWQDWESGQLLYESVYNTQPELVFG
jgi:microcompartment protein CcmK/EutM